MGVPIITVYRTKAPGLSPTYSEKPPKTKHPVEEFKITLTKQGVIQALNGLASWDERGEMVSTIVQTLNEKTTGASSSHVERGQSPMYRPDPEDEAVLAGKSPSYIYGWNKAKRRTARAG